jgi:hypothetical protein
VSRILPAALLLVAAPAVAPAQFLPVGQRSFNFGYAPAGFGNGVGFNYGGLSFAYFQTRQLSYVVNNPLLGYNSAVNLSFNYYGARPPFGYGPAAVNPYAAQAAYLYGGTGAAGVNPLVREQQRLLAAGRPTGGDANRLIAEQAGFEFGRKAVEPAAGVVEPALLDPSEPAVLSGEVLNALAAAIRPLAERRKGEPPLFPAEVLARLRFDGPAAADVAALVRDNKLAFPPALQTPEFDRLRAAVEKPAAELVTAAATGRRSDGAAGGRLSAALKAARAEFAPQLRALGVADALAANRFLSALDALADAGINDNLANFYPAKWATGATAAELLTHMARQRLAFGPAGPGDDDAYFAAQRGLAAYLGSLTAAPRR